MPGNDTGMAALSLSRRPRRWDWLRIRWRASAERWQGVEPQFRQGMDGGDDRGRYPGDPAELPDYLREQEFKPREQNRSSVCSSDATWAALTGGKSEDITKVARSSRSCRSTDFGHVLRLESVQ